MIKTKNNNLVRICILFFLFFMLLISWSDDTKTVSTADVLKAIDELFETFPSNLVKAELVGDPTINRDVNFTNDKINLNQKIRLSINHEAYNSFASKFIALLELMSNDKIQDIGVAKPSAEAIRNRCFVFQYAKEPKFTTTSDVKFVSYKLESDIFESLRQLLMRGTGVELTVHFNDESIIPQKHVFSIHDQNNCTINMFLTKVLFGEGDFDTFQLDGYSPCCSLFPWFQSENTYHARDISPTFEQILPFTIYKKDLAKVSRLSISVTPYPDWIAERQTRRLLELDK